MSPDWKVNKKATINSKNKKHKCFQWSIISGLNHNKIKNKDLKKKMENLKRVDIDLLSHQSDWENFEQNNTSIACNVLFVS